MSVEPRKIAFRPLGGLFEQDDVDAVARVLASAAGGGSFFPLPEERQFEEKLAELEGVSRAIAVNSCGTALDACMRVLGIAPGDEVITTPLTFICTATCASALGAKVMFADIDPVTLNLTPEAVARKITPRVRAILPVHFAGLPCDLDGFQKLSEETGIPIIYDAAHAVGARFRGRGIGGAGKATCYSFQSNKNMTTLGEGGAVTTDDLSFAESIRQTKTFGFVYEATPRAPSLGFNYRMTKPQLAAGVTQIAKIERIIALRLERFQRLHELLRDIEELILPAGLEPGHACHLFAVRLDSTRVSFSRDDLRKELLERYHVQTVIHYPAVWSWDVFAQLPHDKSDCPIAERACREVLSLPVFPDTTPEDLAYLREAVAAAIASLRKRGA